MRQRRNRLRESSFASLEQAAPISLEMETFRDKRVCIAIATGKTADSIAVLLRGFLWLKPNRMTFEGFLKHPDESWSRFMPDDVYNTLQTQIEENAPAY